MKKTPEELEAIRGRCEKKFYTGWASSQNIPAMLDHISELEDELAKEKAHNADMDCQAYVSMKSERDALAAQVERLEASKDAGLAFAQGRKIAMLEEEIKTMHARALELIAERERAESTCSATQKALGEERAARSEKKVLEAKLADALQANKQTPEEVCLRERVSVWVRKCEELESRLSKLAQERDDVFRQLGESQNLVKELGDKLADHDWCKLAHGSALGEEVALRVKAEAERDAALVGARNMQMRLTVVVEGDKLMRAERNALAETVAKMRAAVSKDRVMFITKREIEDGCFNPDRSKDCACRIREQLRKEILADIDALIAPADKPQGA